jgi:hypothetical protein
MFIFLLAYSTIVDKKIGPFFKSLKNLKNVIECVIQSKTGYEINECGIRSVEYESQMVELRKKENKL